MKNVLVCAIKNAKLCYGIVPFWERLSGESGWKQACCFPVHMQGRSLLLMTAVFELCYFLLLRVGGSLHNLILLREMSRVDSSRFA